MSKEDRDLVTRALTWGSWPDVLIYLKYPCVHLAAKANPAEMDNYKVRKLPTVLLLDSAGREVKRREGSMTNITFCTEFLEKAASDLPSPGCDYGRQVRHPAAWAVAAASTSSDCEITGSSMTTILQWAFSAVALLAMSTFRAWGRYPAERRRRSFGKTGTLSGWRAARWPLRSSTSRAGCCHLAACWPWPLGRGVPVRGGAVAHAGGRAEAGARRSRTGGRPPVWC